MAPKNDKSKSSTPAPVASSETIGGVEIGSVEHLAKTIERLQELQKETLEQTNNLSLIVTQNRQATETNAETIKKVEGLARDNHTNLAGTNARIDVISTQIREMDQKLATQEKLFDLSRKISDCKESLSQREMNDSALYLSLNGIEMTRKAKDLDLENNESDRKLVEDALKKSFGPETLDFILKRTPDGSAFLNMEKLNNLHYEKRYAERVDGSCRNSLVFKFKNRLQLGNFEKAIRRRLLATRDSRRGTLQEHLDLNVFLPWKNGQLLETLLNAQARVSVASHPDTLSGWRLVWKRRYKNSNDLMLISEVRASKEWMQSEEMRSVFFNASGEQIRGHWTFFRNFDFGDPKRTFFPKLQTSMTEETQSKKGKTSSSQAATTENQEERSRDKDKTSGKPTGARAKTTRSKSPRTEVPVVIENVDEENEDELEEEGGCWSDVGKGRGNRRGRGNGANSGRGRGGEAGAGSRRGKGREDPNQPSMKEFIPDPRARLAAGGWS